MGFVNGSIFSRDGRVHLWHDAASRQRAYSGAVMLRSTSTRAQFRLPPSSTYGGTPPSADLTYAISQLQANFPGCTTVAVVCAWFGDSTDITACKIYPSTTYINGTFEKWNGSAWVSDNGWFPGSPNLVRIIPISQDANGLSLTADAVRRIDRRVHHLSESAGLRVVFYPFILMDNGDKRGADDHLQRRDVSTARKRR